MIVIIIQNHNGKRISGLTLCRLRQHSRQESTIKHHRIAQVNHLTPVNIFISSIKQIYELTNIKDK
jgi:hypothetical protein